MGRQRMTWRSWRIGLVFTVGLLLTVVLAGLQGMGAEALLGPTWGMMLGIPLGFLVGHVGGQVAVYYSGLLDEE